jgi:hypothetical protein
LEACCYQAIDVIADWYEDFACQMSALLAAVELVFEVDTCGSVFSEQLCKFDNC